MPKEQDLTPEQAQTEWNAAVAVATGVEPRADEPVAVEPTEPVVVAGAPKEEAAPTVEAITKHDLETLRAGMDALTREVKRGSGKIASWESERDQATRARQATEAAGKEAPSAAQIAAAEGDMTKWTALKGDFPDWSAGMEQFVDAKLASINKRLNAQQPAQQQVPAASAVDENALFERIEQTKVDDKYESWQDDVKTAAFKEWFALQPDAFKALSNSPFARHTLKVLDAYYERDKAVAAIQDARKGKLAAAAAATHVNTRAAPVTRNESQLSADDIWKQEVANALKARETA